MKRLTLNATCACLLIALLATRAGADGGVVRAIEKDGPFQISAFTSPNPLVAGVVDIGVLVQDVTTLAPVPDAEVAITITPHVRTRPEIDGQATTEAATNKLFRAYLVELEAGTYDVVITCNAGERRGQVAFTLEVGAPPPRLATLWPWIAWPVVPIVLFGWHELLAGKRPTSRNRGPERLQ